MVCVLNIEHPDIIRGQLADQGAESYSGEKFHPESYDDDHPQGRVILQNFLRLAGIETQSAADGR